MCVTCLLCGPWANLWPFDGLYCKWYSKLFTVPEKEKRLGVEEKATAGNSFVKSCSLRSCPLPIIPLCLSREGFFPLEPKKQRSKKKIITPDLRLEIMGYDLPQ